MSRWVGYFQKLECSGSPMAKKSWHKLSLFWYNTGVCQTNGQTDGHLCSGYTSACIACYANALVKKQKKFYAPINPAVAELSSQLKVPELTPLKMRGAWTPFCHVLPYFDVWPLVISYKRINNSMLQNINWYEVNNNRIRVYILYKGTVIESYFTLTK